MCNNWDQCASLPNTHNAPGAASNRWPALLLTHAARSPPIPLNPYLAASTVGTYQSVSGALSCIECPVGTYSVMTGSASLKDCLPAPPGNYAEGTGNDGFTPCQAGTFQDLPGQGACKVGNAPITVFKCMHIFAAYLLLSCPHPNCHPQCTRSLCRSPARPALPARVPAHRPSRALLDSMLT